MYFVYHLKSKSKLDTYYVGIATDIERRLAEHNNGHSTHTKKFRPWTLISYTAFTDKLRAEKFECYLKTASGRAFAKKRS